jgi:hypothetical protein
MVNELSIVLPTTPGLTLLEFIVKVGAATKRFSDRAAPVSGSIKRGLSIFSADVEPLPVVTIGSSLVFKIYAACAIPGNIT